MIEIEVSYFKIFKFRYPLDQYYSFDIFDFSRFQQVLNNLVGWLGLVVVRNKTANFGRFTVSFKSPKEHRLAPLDPQFWKKVSSNPEVTFTGA